MMVRFFYNILIPLLIPGALIRLWFRGRREPAYRHHIAERFGYMPSSLGPGADIWLHAVSAGESIAAAPLVEALLAQGHTLVLSTTTPTGRAQLMRQFSGRAVICYGPFDAQRCIKRFLNQVRPKLALMIETEIWPNWMTACASREIPVALLNARLSERSFQGYQKLGSMMGATLRQFSWIAVQSTAHANRFAALGAKADQLSVTGSIKADQVRPADYTEQVTLIRTKCGHRTLLLAASTHPGEEQILLASFMALKVTHPDLLMVLVPRHVQRVSALQTLSAQMGLLSCRATLDGVAEDTDVVIVDVMGQLLYWYGASAVAFVGGSLVPHGGHNFLEAALCGCAIVTGPWVFNFEAQAEQFQRAEALTLVADERALTAALETLLVDPVIRQQQIDRAQQLVDESRGALDQLLIGLSPWLPSRAVTPR
ncbi:MAG: 3-deoxy-D-manno-octulosonic acid transferase [Gammaproteobacteria bacterium]|jgi:3-deoxy-D-manno-octulosonic-acid transferase|nr:3-deoxy-D-manno-octulosonic acid transferase [Gammaproteobacteria bacterium]MBT5053221.1 3-deoxy-D-manno-octulosonic acid transferase [Gammaproteobacteria bacterium]